MRNHIPTATQRAGLFAAGIAMLAALPFLAAGVGLNFIAFDDGPHVTQNPHVTAGLTRDGLRWAFTTFHTGSWHPLTWLSHQLDARGGRFEEPFASYREALRLRPDSPETRRALSILLMALGREEKPPDSALEDRRGGETTRESDR